MLGADIEGRELAKLAQAEGQRFDCAAPVHKVRTCEGGVYTGDGKGTDRGNSTRAGTVGHRGGQDLGFSMLAGKCVDGSVIRSRTEFLDILRTEFIEDGVQHPGEGANL